MSVNKKTALHKAVLAGLCALGALTASNASAAPIVFDFTPTTSAVGSDRTIDLGPWETYTVSGISLTAYAGSYSNNTVTRAINGTGILVGNNRGTDEQGLGVCLGSSNGNCNGWNYNDNPEIDAGKELIQLDIANLLSAGYTSLFVNADSATDSEKLLVNGSTTSTGLGMLLATITSAQGNVAISQNGNFLNFVSDTGSHHDVLLHSLTADKVSVPEPASLALLGVGMIGTGMMARRRRRQSAVVLAVG